MKVKNPHLFLSKEDSRDIEAIFKSVFDDAIHRLSEAGFGLNQINTQVVSDTHNISGAILQEARNGDCGTIVLGRRNLSMVQGFITKREGNKIIHTIRDRSIWVVT